MPGFICGMTMATIALVFSCAREMLSTWLTLCLNGSKQTDKYKSHGGEMRHNYYLLLFDVHHYIIPCVPCGFDTIEAAKDAAKEHADRSYRIGCWHGLPVWR